MKFNFDTSFFQNIIDRPVKKIQQEFERPALPDDMPRRIAFCEQMLTKVTQLGKPVAWATLQLMLADSLERLQENDQGKNQERALYCYQQALTVFTRLLHPKQWALIHSTLATSYMNYIKEEKTANREQAIHHARQALLVFTRQQSSVEWAKVNSLLGFCYQERIEGEYDDNQQQALDYFQLALNILTKESDPTAWAMIQLGQAQIWKERQENTTQALHYVQQALTVFNPSNFPAIWSKAQRILAEVTMNQNSESLAIGIERAIDLYQQALTTLTHEDFVQERAELHVDLARAFQQRIKGDAPANQALAIQHVKQALEIYRQGSTYTELRRAASLLGDLMFEQTRWLEARIAYAEALAAQEVIYQASIGERGRQTELLGTSALVIHQAYALARCGLLTQAVIVLETGRARGLAEALQYNSSELLNVRLKDQAAYNHAVTRVATLQAEQRRQSARGYLITTIDLRAARSALQTIIASIRSYLPTFLAEVDYTTIQQAAKATVPLIYILTTQAGSLLLLVPSRGEPQAVWCNDFTEAHLEAYLYSDDRPGYLAGAVGGNLSALQRSLTKMLPSLGEHLLAPLLTILHRQHITNVILIPCGQLALLPLHTAFCDNNHCFLEKICVSYAPSAQAVVATSKALETRTAPAPILAGVGDPDQTLTYAWPETMSIAELARARKGSARVLRQEQGTLAALMESLPGATHLHLSCHSYFNPLMPLNSALLLAHKERLTLRMILNDLHLQKSGSIRLVVMSACQTAISDFRTLPDEAIGLPAGFIQAGVPGVIGTLWRVNDVSTALLMIMFYQYIWIEEREPADALRSAQFWLRNATNARIAELCRRYPALTAFEEQFITREIDKEDQQLSVSDYDQKKCPFTHPYFWAGFVFYGA